MDGSYQDQSLRLGASLQQVLQDHSRFASRIREVAHSVESENSNLTLRLHYPSFRNGKPTIAELAEVLSYMVTHFCIPRSQLASLSSPDFDADHRLIESNRLYRKAIQLFKKAQKLSNRNGEAGELLLFVLTEWILKAPQILAKMSLKTNPNMPVHGADGIHVRYCSISGSLKFYWGESKLYSDLGSGVSSAVRSVCEALADDALSHELELVKNNIALTGLDDLARVELLKYLDPFDESYNSRQDVVTCLIGFDFSKYAELTGSHDVEEKFKFLAEEKLKEVEPQLSRSFSRNELLHTEIQLFLLPLPSVQELRDKFQDVIGWEE
ncbi:DUF1837 domain-containing protein [Pseudomonas sp. WOUb67]|uniref:HamA C-terminal domain-containing protein n=1 Tax=Pseudomonas sp. WOUb67 TaxID=3161136 RepID=UPI003CED09F8